MAVEYRGSGLKGAVLPGSVHMLLILRSQRPQMSVNGKQNKTKQKAGHLKIVNPPLPLPPGKPFAPLPPPPDPVFATASVPG